MLQYNHYPWFFTCEVIKKRNETVFYYTGLITMIKKLLTMAIFICWARLKLFLNYFIFLSFLWLIKDCPTDWTGLPRFSGIAPAIYLFLSFSGFRVSNKSPSLSVPVLRVHILSGCVNVLIPPASCCWSFLQWHWGSWPGWPVGWGWPGGSGRQWPEKDLVSSVSATIWLQIYVQSFGCANKNEKIRLKNEERQLQIM